MAPGLDLVCEEEAEEELLLEVSAWFGCVIVLKESDPFIFDNRNAHTKGLEKSESIIKREKKGI